MLNNCSVRGTDHSEYDMEPQRENRPAAFSLNTVERLRGKRHRILGKIVFRWVIKVVMHINFA